MADTQQILSWAKANAPFGRWKYEFPDGPYQCKVCGHTFNPSEHHSTVPYDGTYDREATSLKSQLGIPGYNKFARQFLRHRGCSEKQAKEVMTPFVAPDPLPKIRA